MKPEDALTVSIAHDPKNIEKSITTALTEVALDDFKDKVVAIKPNDTTATADDKTACTQADTLRATIQFVKNLHPERSSSPGAAGDMETEDVFKVLGYPEVIAVRGGRMVRPQQGALRGRQHPLRPPAQVMVNPRVLEYEKLVSLAQLKVHRTATVTLAIKNIAMSYPGGRLLRPPAREPEAPPAQHPQG